MNFGQGIKNIQVFEHGSLLLNHEYNGIRITVDHLNALNTYARESRNKYFNPILNGIRFTQYVGAIQVGDLTIEILPKIDETGISSEGQWQSVLLDMLRACHWVKVETLHTANLRLKPNSVLEIYFELFLEETARILQEGLIRSYERRSGQLHAVKGRILFEQQIRNNLIRKDRIYANYESYNYGHLLNNLLVQALQTMRKLSLRPELESLTIQLLNRFPKFRTRKLSQTDIDTIVYNRKTFRYKTAIDIARLIIGNFSPDIRFGRYNLLAMLFDMNRLFEEYIYRQLLKYCGDNKRLFRQTSTYFWDKRKIQPDMVLKADGVNYILDTKWKTVKNAQPSISDLKQMFVYSQYFDAQYSILIYPAVEAQEDIPPIPYAPNASGQLSYCQTIFLPLLKDGRLNREIGLELLRKITAPAENRKRP